VSDKNEHGQHAEHRVKMAKYKFRLATLQKVREARRDRERTALAEAFRAEQVLSDRRTELAAEEAALRDLQRSATGGRILNINRLVEAQRYELVLRAASQELARQQALLSVEIERRRKALVEADREVRVLEQLDERQHEEHRRLARRLETKQLDEAALQRFKF
jgi:flagellar protein FliJ